MENLTFAKIIEDEIKDKINYILQTSYEMPDTDDFCETDNFGEIIEKLIIIHIRMWMIEDRISIFIENDKEVADLKRKLDICFKQKRPKLVQAINKLIDNSIKYNRSLVEDSVKVYIDKKN